MGAKLNIIHMLHKYFYLFITYIIIIIIIICVLELLHEEKKIEGVKGFLFIFLVRFERTF